MFLKIAPPVLIFIFCQTDMNMYHMGLMFFQQVWTAFPQHPPKQPLHEQNLQN